MDLGNEFKWPIYAKKRNYSSNIFKREYQI